MEESEESRIWFYRKRRVIVGVLIIFFLFLAPLSMEFLFSSPPPSDPEITHQITVWIQPGDETFDLCIDFYNTEQGAVEGINRERGIQIVIEPLDDEENRMHLNDMQRECMSFWLKVYFSDYSEDINAILEIELAQMKTITLVGREISILWELWHGEQS